MTLAKVLEQVVASEKNKSLYGKKIFVVQPLGPDLKKVAGSAGATYLAIDHGQQAGPGDVVIVCREGNGCRQMMADDGAPVNALIAGIVDHVEI